MSLNGFQSLCLKHVSRQGAHWVLWANFPTVLLVTKLLQVFLCTLCLFPPFTLFCAHITEKQANAASGRISKKSITLRSSTITCSLPWDNPPGSSSPHITQIKIPHCSEFLSPTLLLNNPDFFYELRCLWQKSLNGVVMRVQAHIWSPRLPAV